MTLRFLPSFKISVPVLLIAFAGLLSASYLYYTLPRTEEAIEKRYIEDLYREMSGLQGTIEYLIRKKDWEGVRWEVMMIASDLENRLVFVLDENHRIIASTRRSWIARNVEQVMPEFDAKTAGQTEKQRRAQVKLAPDRLSLFGYTTINLGAKKKELRPSRIGLLFFHKDLADAKEQAKTQILNQSLYWVALVSTLALLLGVVFHFSLTRRAGRLVSAAEALARGDLQVRSKLSGADELARLSAAFDAMAEKIAITQDRLNRDIAERKRVETNLKESELRLQQILNNAISPVYVKDTEGRFIFINRHFTELFDLSWEEVIGKTAHEILPKQTADEFRTNDLLVLEKQEPIEFEETAPLDDGVHTYISIKFPLFTADGKPYAVCGISTDISARIRTERVLRAAALGVSKARGKEVFAMLVRHLATALEVDFALIGLLSSPDQIRTIALWAHGEIVENITYDLVGSPCENVFGQKYRYYPDNIQTRFPNDTLLAEIGAEGYSALPLFDSSGDGIGLLAILDSKPLKDKHLTESILRIFATRASGELERKRTDEVLRSSEEQYRVIFNAMTDGLLVWRFDGTMVDINPALCAMFGYTREELLHMPMRQIVHPDSMYLFKEFEATMKRANDFHCEAQTIRRDGTVFDIELHVVPMSYKGKPHHLSIVRDITERKRIEAERLELEAQLRQAQKMEAIGQLTGGVAHDFNNILTSVLGNATLALEAASTINNAKLQKYLNNVHRSGERARDLIRQMLTFSRGQRGEPRILSLTPLVNDTVKLMSSTLPSSVELRIEALEEINTVKLDPVQVEQVLMNLCINARDAMDGAGIITISLRNCHCEGAVCTGCRRAFNGDFVELAVKDTGTGMETETVDRMFEPFYTTKEIGKGTGMGLSMVHGIVHEHGGHIIVETAPSKGATFRIVFPTVLEHPRKDATDKDTDSLTGQPSKEFVASVMVIDDEELVADFMGDLLESRGFKVTVMTNSVEAREVFSRKPEAYDLVITDQTMPKITGIELAKVFLQLRPNIPIILYTGYSEELHEEQAYKHGIRGYLKKPVEINALMRTIGNLMDKPQTRVSAIQ